MTDGKEFAVQATIQGDNVRVKDPEGREQMYRLIEENSLGDPVRTLRINKDNVQAIVMDRAPK